MLRAEASIIHIERHRQQFEAFPHTVVWGVGLEQELHRDAVCCYVLLSEEESHMLGQRKLSS